MTIERKVSFWTALLVSWGMIEPIRKAASQGLEARIESAMTYRANVCEAILRHKDQNNKPTPVVIPLNGIGNDNEAMVCLM